MKVITKSEAETKKVGIDLAQSLVPGSIIALIGELGSGKTCLTQGILEGLSCDCTAVSPSFVLQNIYFGTHPIYHYDLYRLDDYTDINHLQIDDEYYGDGITIIEWADKLGDKLDSQGIRITFTVLGVNERLIEINSNT